MWAAAFHGLGPWICVTAVCFTDFHPECLEKNTFFGHRVQPGLVDPTLRPPVLRSAFSTLIIGYRTQPFISLPFRKMDHPVTS